MSITYDNGVLTIDNVKSSFWQIYWNYRDMYPDIIQRLSNTIYIDADVHLINNSEIEDLNTSITVTGETFLIVKGSTLTLGRKTWNNRGSQGCILHLPNITDLNFGNPNILESGNLKAYSSKIMAYGYWSFYAGDNEVELIDCIIDGYGRISGPSSVIKECTFERSNGTYGVLSYVGEIQEYSNITVNKVESNIDNNSAPMIVAEYDDNSTLAIYYGEYSGYNELVKVLDSTYDYDIIFYGTKLNSGYVFNRNDMLKNNLYHKYKFKAVLQSNLGMNLTNAKVKITNKVGEVEFDGYSDESGYIDTWLTYYRDLKGSNVPGEVLTPHRVNISVGNLEYMYIININRNLDDFPILLSENSSQVDLTEIINKVNNNVIDSQNVLVTLLDSIHAEVAKTYKTNITYTRNGVKITI